MIVFRMVSMNREIDGLFNRGAQSEFVYIILNAVTENVLSIVRLVVREHCKGCVVEVLDVDVEVSILNLRKIILKAHKELSVVCLCMVSLLAKSFCPATASVTPITFPPLCSPWISQLDKSMLFA